MSAASGKPAAVAVPAGATVAVTGLAMVAVAVVGGYGLPANAKSPAFARDKVRGPRGARRGGRPQPHLVRDRLRQTGRVLSDPPSYIELAMSFGADEPVPGLGEYVATVLNATNFEYGAFHIEMMQSPNGPVLIEINARPMGHGCHQCVNALGDRPLGDEIARRYLGLDRAIHPSFSHTKLP
jgi:hypothetical protein